MLVVPGACQPLCAPHSDGVRQSSPRRLARARDHQHQRARRAHEHVGGGERQGTRSPDGRGTCMREGLGVAHDSAGGLATVCQPLWAWACGRPGGQSRGRRPRCCARYYRIVAFLRATELGILGPFVNAAKNDRRSLNDFLTAAGGSPQPPRGIFIQGDGFAQSERGSAASTTRTHSSSPTSSARLPQSVVPGALGKHERLCRPAHDHRATNSTTSMVVRTRARSERPVYNANPALAEAQVGGTTRMSGLTALRLGGGEDRGTVA